MKKTKAQKYNEKLEEIFNPEIERLKKREEISRKILNNIKERVDIDYCNLEEWQLIDIIGKEINHLVK